MKQLKLRFPFGFAELNLGETYAMELEVLESKDFIVLSQGSDGCRRQPSSHLLREPGLGHGRALLDGLPGMHPFCS